MNRRYISLIAMLGVLAACDPAIDEVDTNAFYSESDLASSVEISQPFAEYPDVLSFKTSPAKFIQILDENGGVVASGTACDSFKVAPGLPGNFTIKALSQDGKTVTTTKTVTVSKYTNVPKSWYNITGNAEGEFSNAAEWVWDQESNGGCWGNAGYRGGTGDPSNVPGKWWGATIADFPGQLNHAVGGALTGEESADAKMVISGATITKYAGDGSVLASGAFSIKDVAGDDFKVADLTTTNNTVLWPYQINGGGKYVNNFEVTFLNENYMQLIYAPAGTGSWSECTWWEFKRKGVGAYVNPKPYEVWNNDCYTIVDASGAALAGVNETAVQGDKMTFSYISLDKDFIFKAKVIESTKTLNVPEGTTFVDITPANATLNKVAGKDTTEVAQSGASFTALDANLKYDVTVTYDSKKKHYSIYYTEFDASSSLLSIVAPAASEESTKSFAGIKTVTGSVTTYTFQDVSFDEGAKEFYFSNQKKEASYKEEYDFSDISLLKGDDKIFEAGASANGIQLIKLASSIKEPVTFVLTIYDQSNGSKVVYLTATGAAK